MQYNREEEQVLKLKLKFKVQILSWIFNLYNHT